MVNLYQIRNCMNCNRSMWGSPHADRNKSNNLSHTTGMGRSLHAWMIVSLHRRPSDQAKLWKIVALKQWVLWILPPKSIPSDSNYPQCSSFTATTSANIRISPSSPAGRNMYRSIEETGWNRCLGVVEGCLVSLIPQTSPIRMCSGTKSLSYVSGKMLTSIKVCYWEQRRSYDSNGTQEETSDTLIPPISSCLQLLTTQIIPKHLTWGLSPPRPQIGNLRRLRKLTKIKKESLCVVASNPNTQVTDAGGSLWVWGQPGLHSKLQNRQNHREILILG
jgi:hypothetical protein